MPVLLSFTHKHCELGPSHAIAEQNMLALCEAGFMTRVLSSPLAVSDPSKIVAGMQEQTIFDAGDLFLAPTGAATSTSKVERDVPDHRKCRLALTRAGRVFPPVLLTSLLCVLASHLDMCA